MTLLGIFVVLAIWASLAAVRRRVIRLEGQVANVDELKNELTRLTAKVTALERGESAARHIPLDLIDAARPASPVPPTVKAPVRPPASAPATPSPARSDSTPSPAAGTPAPAPLASPVPPVSSRSTTAGDADSWELVVGTNWLNKIGVLVLVMGLALLLGYSMANVGPAGRVVMGIVASAALGVAGRVIERRSGFRAYGRALIAGGWAGAYVTAFAMRAIPAARVLESDVAGLVVLLLVAAGMVVHSLRYRSETLTTLAFVAAYLPLALTPLTTYSLAASVPLAVALVATAQRFGWSSIAALGVAVTYGIFTLRGHVLPGALPDASSAGPYLVLAVNWIAFEAADVLALRSPGPTKSPRRAPLFAMNAVGAIGAALLLADRGGEGAMFRVLVTAAFAYLASALVRRRLLPPATEPDAASQATAFTSTHAALALSAGMMAWALGLRSEGPQLTLALLLETELFIAAGLTLRDPQVRRIGVALGWLVSAQTLSLVLPPGRPDLTWPWTMAAWTPAAALVTTAWYVNREWIRASGARFSHGEWILPWAALVMVGAIIGHDVGPLYRGLAGLAVSLVLLEAGVRRSAEYRAQSLAALTVAALSVFVAFGPEAVPPSGFSVWMVMPAAIAAAYGYAWRAQVATGGDDQISRVATGIAASAGTVFLATFEWRVLPVSLVGLAWAATALALLVAGMRRQAAGLRWQAFALLAVAVTYASQWAISEVVAAERIGESVLRAPVLALAVSAVVYAAALVARRRRVPDDRVLQTAEQLERLATFGLPLVAGLHVLGVESAWLGMRHVPVGWMLTAVALLVTGLRWRAADLRLQAWGVFALTSLVTLFFIVIRPQDSSVAWLAVTTAGFYVAGLASRRALRAADGHADMRRLDNGARLMTLTAASVLLATLVAVEAPSSIVTMGWGLQGTILLVVGFPARERALRLAGLVLLFACILKLFLYDLRELEALARIVSFVVLGLVLLGVSWTYTRYKDQIRRLF